MIVWVRRCLTVASLLAVWLVARPASASAPLCDYRGASVLAPLPVLDIPTASLDVGEHPDGCDDSGARDKAYHRGERPPRFADGAHAEGLPVAATSAPPRYLTGLLTAQRHQPTEHVGVARSLERPPRSVR